MDARNEINLEVARLTALKPLGDPDLAKPILDALLTTFDASGGRIYFLYMPRAEYRSVARDRRSNVVASFDARRLRDASRRDWGPLELAVAERSTKVYNQPTFRESHGLKYWYNSRIVFPIIRGTTVVGLVDLHSKDRDKFSSGVQNLDRRAGLAIKQLAHAHEAQMVLQILRRTAQFRVSLHEQESRVIDNVVRFVAESSQMQYVIMRKLEPDGSLTCIATHGFGSSKQPTLSLNDIREDYVPFQRVIETLEHWTANDLKSDIYGALKRIPALKDVRSFVACPILVGQSLWGVLSFASAVAYEYSELEVFALRALANLAGVALDAAKSAATKAETQYDDGRLMQAVLSNELITATRHEMYNQLEMVGLARTVIAGIARSANEHGRSQRFFREDIDMLRAQAEYLNDAHIHMNKVMDTIRFSQGEPLSDCTKVNVSEVWARAIEPFAYRLDRADVSRAACELSPLVNVSGSFDWLRIVFTHLILNSLDAFDRGWAKQRREILLVPGARSKGRVTLRYIDTAGGIEVNELRRHGVLIDDPRPNTIFDRYVTSKPKGTGLGLASCRAALSTMEGSIELVDWKKGATFDIQLDSWEDD